MAVQSGKGRNEQVYIRTSTIICYTRKQGCSHAIMESTHAIIQPTKAMQRSYDRLFIMYTLISFT